MSNQEKRHRTSMQHLRYLNSFMDEIDREVMSLTDRAFKSLCIGDEAIYNDSEFSPSPVSCHKPRVEDVSKKTQESTFSAVRKLDSYHINGEIDLLSRPSKSSKDSSLFAVFAAKKNGESAKMTNGDSWDKSALLSIQRELSEFSSDYHSLTAEHLSQAKNHLKSGEKVSVEKSGKNELMPSGKSSKSKHHKNNKLRKLNYINFFLHSEFSPFLSWRDFNQFSIGPEHISEIMLNDRSPEWYDSPLYKELTAAHEHYKLSLPTSVEKCPEQKETHSPKPQLAPVKSAAPTVLPKPDKESEHIQRNIPTKASPLETEQRCNSERAEPCAPWRKSRSRAKSAAPVGHSIINSPVCERRNPGERSAQTFKKDVKTVEDQASASSTPFSISQLLTPVIPSRHGTGTSEILQTVLSPTALEIPAIHERDLHPSPEIKREGYKSIASSLLFNLKDNRKRVKTMYSPPKFKGLDVANQSKESPQLEVSKDRLEIPEVSDAKTISPARQKPIISPMSPLLENADTQSCSPANGRVPDDYLGLSLLQSGKAKSNRSPAANKATYPSLQLYQKSSPGEINIRANAQAAVDTCSQVFKDKATKDHDTERNYPSELEKGVELQSKNIPLESRLNAKKLTVDLNSECNTENKSGKSPNVSLANTEQQIISEGTSQIKDRLKTTGVVSAQKSPVKEKELNRKEAGAKHVFSARQNNYIKSQRFVSTDDDNDHSEDSSNPEKGLLTVKDYKNGDDEQPRHSRNAKTKDARQKERNESMHREKVLVQTTVDAPLLKERVHVRGEATTDQSSIISKSGLGDQKENIGNPDTMKGNTFAKRALFASMEQESKKTNTTLLKKDDAVIDKYDLAKMAIEEVIAEREQKKLCKAVSNLEGSIADRKGVRCKEPQDGIELPIKTEKELPCIFMLNERVKGAKEAKGQNTVSAIKTNWQTVKTMPEDMAKHGESHVSEVKLARPCKQEESIGQCQHSEPIKYNETDRLCLDSKESNIENVSKGEKMCQKKELINKNRSNLKKAAMSDHLGNNDIRIVGQCEKELGVAQKDSSYKPEIPPRRGRSNSQSNECVGENIVSKLDFREGDVTVKTEEMKSKEVGKVQSSQSKNRGPVKGNVTSLKEKYDKESKMVVQKGLSVEGTCSEKSMEEGTHDKAPKDKMKHKFVPPKLTVSDPESGTCSIIYKEMDSENERMSTNSSRESEKGEEHSGSQRKRSVIQPSQKDIHDITNNMNEELQDDKQVNRKVEDTVRLKELEDKQNKSKGPSKSYVKDFLNGLLGLSSSEKLKTVSDPEEELSETLSSESFKTDKGRKDSITVYDIIGKRYSVTSLNGKPAHHSSQSSNSSEFSLLHESEPGAQPEEFSWKSDNTKEKIDGKVKENIQEPTIDSCSISNHESESDISDRVVSPPSDVDKRGWVQSLIESARDLKPISHSHGSSKDQQEIGQRLSMKDQLNGTENDEEDLNLFKDRIHSPVPIPGIPVKSPPPNQPAMHFLSLPATHLVTVKQRKLSAGSASVSEEEERRSAVSTLSEGLDGYETSGGDLMEENISSTAPTEESNEPSERSGSACSGSGQNKPPVVPPKTEKALRRAMKLTTRRIQKAEAKSKSERKGRSGDKTVKAERRHHSTDHRSLSSDRISSKHSEHFNHTFEPKSQKTEKHDRHRNDPNSQSIEGNDPSKKLDHATKVEVKQTSQTGDSKSHNPENQHQQCTSNHGDRLENGNVSNDSDRLGRRNEKYLPKKLERRTQSLDRFLRDKHESVSSSTGETAGVNSEFSTKGSQLSTSEASPLHHNSIEHTYTSANHLVTQSFPITQRKLLQDPDSGQYFLVDMPVQVKTKTFFDPETKSYVQLPVQSPERQAPPMEVMNTPSLMVFHGFVPVPVASQKSVVRTQGSVIPPDDQEDFDTSMKQMQGDFCQMQNEEINAYIEPVYIAQEHTPEEEIDSVR
ncbi:uncharacterized protein LOC130238272 [Danio aesculapii]|uniref:uncharacterized protein LOC130238272 n=1 Tax=Danio aesculapii TaxID=1142201 RepID=UPI0024BFBC0D|nr:uncharacterized protein LOC130238272 [Danio aesculapii]